ncbi:MAG: hypothetical protein NTV55_07190 [Planctomycetota bacterium]|nr:hypothetical protein [Planctomycetota bacterium]
MGIRIDVLKGPDAGWAFVVHAREARIGRGGGNHIRLNDQAWQEGFLELIGKDGGWLLVNRMPHGIFHRNEVLEPGKSRTWYEGEIVQPTGETLLSLKVDDKSKPNGQPVTALPPAKGKKIVPAWKLALLGGLLLLLAWFWVNQPGAETGQAFGPVRLPEAILAKEGHNKLKDPVQRLKYLLAETELLLAGNRLPESMSSIRTTQDQVERMILEDSRWLPEKEMIEFREGLQEVKERLGGQMTRLARLAASPN